MAKEHIQKGDGGLSAFVIQQTKNGGEASNVELFFSRIQNGTKTLQGYFNINILGMYIYKMYQFGF